MKKVIKYVKGLNVSANKHDLTDMQKTLYPYSCRIHTCIKWWAGEVPKYYIQHDSLLIKYKTTKIKIHNFRHIYKCNKTI